MNSHIVLWSVVFLICKMDWVYKERVHDRSIKFFTGTVEAR